MQNYKEFLKSKNYQPWETPEYVSDMLTRLLSDNFPRLYTKQNDKITFTDFYLDPETNLVFHISYDVVFGDIKLSIYIHTANVTEHSVRLTPRYLTERHRAVETVFAANEYYLANVNDDLMTDKITDLLLQLENYQPEDTVMYVGSTYYYD